MLLQLGGVDSSYWLYFQEIGIDSPLYTIENEKIVLHEFHKNIIKNSYFNLNKVQVKLTITLDEHYECIKTYQ